MRDLKRLRERFLRDPLMQRELCRWRRLWRLEPARSLLAFRAQQMSDRLLELSGLTAKAEPVSGSGSRRVDTGLDLP